ncbi:MAG: YihY/virulence factor BrkB family protein [Betaproteobacteria bacterium]
MSHGAAVAFYAAFSIAPLLIIVANVMVWILGDQSAQAALLEALTNLIGDQATASVAEIMAHAPTDAVDPTHSSAGSWLALGITLVGTTGVFVELRAALQDMLGEQEQSFSLWKLVEVRLIAIGVVLGSGFLLSVAMVTQTAVLVALRWLTHAYAWLAPLVAGVELIWSYAVVTVLFAALMRWLPDARMRWRQALIGAAVAGLLFMVGRYAISLYISTTATRSALGAAGSFAALLVWVYWSSQIFLLGAALAVELTGAPRKSSGESPEAATPERAHQAN